MLKLKLTKNRRGMELIGDYEDFESLQESLHTIADIDYNEAMEFGNMANMLLGLSYDIRHANMGMRETQMMDNGSSMWNVRDRNKILKSLSKENIYYRVKIPVISCVSILIASELLEYNGFKKYEYLIKNGYPDVSKPIHKKATDMEEALYFDARNKMSLIELRIKAGIDTGNLDDPYAQLVKFRKAVSVLNLFKEQVWETLGSIIDSKTLDQLYHKCKQVPFELYDDFKNFPYQYYESLDIQYISVRNNKQRLELLPKMMNDMLELAAGYADFIDYVIKEAQRKDCHPSELTFDYQEIKNW